MSVLIDFSLGPNHENQISSDEIWARLQQTGEITRFYKPENIVHFDGTVSLRFRGRELLGPDYWIELFPFIQLAPLLTGQASEITERVYEVHRNGTINFASQGLSVDYLLEVDGVPVVRERLPLVPLVEAWTLMRFTLYRLQYELGDRTSDSAINHVDSFYGPGYFAGLEDIVAYALETPLSTLLEKPREFHC